MAKLLVALILAGLAAFAGYELLKGEPAPPPESSEVAGALVASFGTRLQMVPLSGSTEAAAAAMEEHYAPFVTRDLLAQWKADPAQAPGRLTSSPWPDRIEVGDVVADADGGYAVTGTVIEVTSADLKGGISNAYPVRATVSKEGPAWRISSFARE